MLWHEANKLLQAAAMERLCHSLPGPSLADWAKLSVLAHGHACWGFCSVHPVFAELIGLARRCQTDFKHVQASVS